MLIYEDCKVFGNLPVDCRRKLLYNDKLDENMINYVLLLYRLEIDEPIFEIKIMDSTSKYYDQAYCWICGSGSMTIIFLNVRDETIEYNYRKDRRFCDIVPSKNNVRKIIMHIKKKITVAR
jgi:hypothetical protein